MASFFVSLLNRHPQVQSIHEKSSLGKFMDFATEAFNPGHVQGNEQKFYETKLGQLLDYAKPNGTRMFDKQRDLDKKMALAQFAANMPADPVAQIQQMVKIDPENAAHYISALMAYQQNQNDPLHKAQLAKIEQEKAQQEAILASLGGQFQPAPAVPPPLPVSEPTPSDAGAMAPMRGFKDPQPAQNPLQEFEAAQAQQQAITGVSEAQNPVAAQNVATPLSRYQQAEIQALKMNPTPEQYNHYLSSLKEADSDKTSEIKNYEYAKTHPDFAGSKSGVSVITPENAGLTGDAFIDTIPDQDVRNKARALLRGDAPYPNITSRTPTAMKQALEAAQAADPSYSASTYPARVQNAKYFSPSGEGGKLLSSVKAIAKHINTMQESYDKMDNSSLTPVNYVANKVSKLSDNPTHSGLNAFETAVNNVAPELAKVIVGKSNIAEGEIEEQRKTFSAYDGPEAFKASAQTAAEMVAARAQIMLDNYQQVMGGDKKPPAPSFDKKTVETFKKLGVDLGDYFEMDADAAPPDVPPDVPADDRKRILELLEKR